MSTVTKVQARGVELPKFRYLDDFVRQLDTMKKEVRDIQGLMKEHRKMISASLTQKGTEAVRYMERAAMVFNIIPEDRKDQLKTIRKMKEAIDPKAVTVQVQNLAKLKSQYSLAEDLYEKHRTLEAMETQLTMQFPDRKGDAFKAAIGSIKELKKQVSESLKEVFAYLNEVAAKHVPKEFTDYMTSIAKMVDDHVIFKDSELFLYASVDDEGSLLFTYYLMLINVSNDEAQITPHLYISVQWKLAKQASAIKVQLNHEYEIPNTLAKSGGTEVTSVGDAVKAIATLLELENFSSALGVVPLALQMKVDPTTLNMKMFSFQNFISSIVVEETSITFVLRKEVKDAKLIAEIGAALYAELKSLMKNKAKMFMVHGKKGSNESITYKIARVAEAGEFSAHDAEFLRERFNLSDSAMRKVVNILNNQ